MTDENVIFECPECGCSSWNQKDATINHCDRCKKSFDMKDYVKVEFKFRGKTSEELLHWKQAWEVAQAMKRMTQQRLHVFMEHNRQDEPEMIEGFKLIRRPLNKVGIDPR